MNDLEQFILETHLRMPTTCQSTSFCIEYPTHFEVHIESIMERKYPCCSTHCKCDWG